MRDKDVETRWEMWRDGEKRRDKKRRNGERRG